MAYVIEIHRFEMEKNQLAYPDVHESYSSKQAFLDVHLNQILDKYIEHLNKKWFKKTGKDKVFKKNAFIFYYETINRKKKQKQIE